MKLARTSAILAFTLVACDDPRWNEVAAEMSQQQLRSGDSSGHGGGRPRALNVQLGPRPFFLVDDMDEGPLKKKLQSCTEGPFERSDFSIGHRGAALQFPEHTKESYLAAARMGAGILECDVTFTKDRQLVCRHSQCDLHTTTNILAMPELAAKCTQPFTPVRSGHRHAGLGEVLHQRHHARRVQEPVREDGRLQPEGDHGGRVPGRHAQLPHRPVLDLRHAADPRREHQAVRRAWAPSSRPS